jgi:hypothetical protein
MYGNFDKFKAGDAVWFYTGSVYSKRCNGFVKEIKDNLMTVEVVDPKRPNGVYETTIQAQYSTIYPLEQKTIKAMLTRAKKIRAAAETAIQYLEKRVHK